jgi:SAM-dependent methyltransferase
MSTYSCRSCFAPLRHSFCDLGMSPLSNAFVRAERLNAAETFYPLHVYVCDRCWLVQLPEHENPTHIFADDYAYFSSYSDSWLKHAQTYTEQMVARFGYSANSQVVEIASNDGYLLRYFHRRGVPVLGIEPAANCAKAAEDKGVPTRVSFFGAAAARILVEEGLRADLLIGNNVLAHVPDLNDFVSGLAILLKPDGVITMEFPHLLQLMRHNQFDTIYHEHYSYLSFLAIERVFNRHGLTLFDVEHLSTHGGSLRIFARHANDASKPVGPAIEVLRAQEQAAGLESLAAYSMFSNQVIETKSKLLEFLIAVRRAGKKVWAYGAPAKGNTLLNFCGIRSDFIEATVDRSPHKQGRFLPGTHIPIHAPERLIEARPDYVLILPWNLRDEITEQMAQVREWSGQFVVPIPELRVLP